MNKLFKPRVSKYFAKSASLILALGIISWFGCQKEVPFETSRSSALPTTQTKSSILVDPMTTEWVREVNGLLEFKNYAAFKSIYDALQNLSKNSAYKSKLLTQWGYDIKDDADKHFPEEPVLEAFEQRFQLKTVRKKEDEAFIDFLNQGGNPTLFVGDFLFDPILKAFLNTQHEVKIGTTIFKFYAADQTAIVRGEDWNVLNEIRKKPYSELTTGYNLSLSDVYSTLNKDSDLFDRDADGNRLELRALCQISFELTNISSDGNTFTFNNTSQLDFPCLGTSNWLWDFGDGTTFTGRNPPPHSFSSSLSPEVRLTYLCTKGDACSGNSFTMRVRDQCRANFTTQITQGNVVRVNVVNPIPNMTYTWNFGDGTTGSGARTQHVYPVNGFNRFNISLTASNPRINCLTTTTLSVQVGCGVANGKEARDVDQAISNRTWRLTGVIWSQNNIFQNTLGSSSKTYRKSLGIFWKRAVDQLDVSIEGDFFERDQDLEGNRICIPVNLPFLEETETASGYVARNITGTNDVFFLDRALISSHRARQGTTTWNLSRLFLVD